MHPTPEIWGKGSFYASHKRVFRELAHWLVRQSPYLGARQSGRGVGGV